MKRELTGRGSAGARPPLISLMTALALVFGSPHASGSDQAYDLPYAFTTLAGKASLGSADGIGEAARFAQPYDVACDLSGNLYVADTANHTVRKITPAGVVTTLAGLAGVSGFADGTGTAARFAAPQSIAVDAAGNVLVAELTNGTIRRISPDGTVTTLVHLPSVLSYSPVLPVLPGYVVDTYGPTNDIAVATDGSVYAADTFGNRILKIAPDGAIAAIAGSADSWRGSDTDGTGSGASFCHPRGLALDSTGDIYVADTGNDAIRKVTSAGVVSTIPVHDSSNDSFTGPKSLSLDSMGNLYVVFASSVWRLTPAGAVSRLATLESILGNTSIYYYYPTYYPDGSSVDASGNLYIADTGNSKILRLSPAGMLTTVAGFGPACGGADGAGSAARFFCPSGVAVDSSCTVYVADTGNHTIRKISPQGAVTTLAGLAGSEGSADGIGSAARFNAPAAVAVDAAGIVYVADTDNFTIRRISPEGVVTTLAGLAGSFGGADGSGTSARFVMPHSLALDVDGSILVADFPSSYTFEAQRTIRRVTPDGVVTTRQVIPNAPNISSRVRSPLAIAVDPAGDLVAADCWASVIWRIPRNGTPSVVAGVGAAAGGDAVDGTGTAARFTYPTSVAVGPDSNVYITDNHSIRRMAPGGIVNTLAGIATIFGGGDGIGPAARFNGVSGIAVDGVGRLYVADTYNHTVRLGAAASAPAIITPPQSQTAAKGSGVQFSVAVSGVPDPTFQWYFNGAAIDGANAASLSIMSVQAASAGSYSVRVSNALGSVTSSAAVLSVTEAASSSSPSGGGGAIEPGFAGALLLFALGSLCLRGKDAAAPCAQLPSRPSRLRARKERQAPPSAAKASLKRGTDPVILFDAGRFLRDLASRPRHVPRFHPAGPALLL